MFNSSSHRDGVIKNRALAQTAKPWKSQFIQKTAAERIQRAWRSWHAYCQEHQDWMTTTRICATMIQARWRSYHVRRVKLDKAAGVIQRHIRGFLVRLVLKRHTAAVTIQRHVVGLLTRKQIWRLNKSATDMQRLVRGGIARKAVKDLLRELTKVVVILQRSIRGFLGKRIARERADERERTRILIRATIDIQRFHRGWKGRQRALERYSEYKKELEMHQAATRLQSMARRDQATKRVNKIREDRLQKMNHSATFVRKLWLAYITRRRYLELKQEFEGHIDSIITQQRYIRGFLVRLRMWREAIRAEEELWAVVEIQRIWRGYIGRLRWENKYEETWAREIAAARMQRAARGWLARTRVNRIQRKIARAEFDKARLRFKSSQRIQALGRGVLVRKVIRVWRERIVKAVVTIQRIARGHALRRKLWDQVLHQRATMIGAVMRGYLVRKRRFHLLAKVIMLQQNYRLAMCEPQEVRKKRQEMMNQRKRSAKIIQSHVRKQASKKQVADVKEGKS